MKVKIQAGEAQRRFLWAICEDNYYEAIGFGGARGGGKTFISCLAMVLRRLRYPGTRGLMLRRVQTAADQNLGEEVRKVLTMLGIPQGTGGVVWLETKKRFIFPNGAYIQLGYCRQENDWERYQGIEYTDIAFEEAGQFPEKAWLNIVGSNRTNSIDPTIKPKVWATFNPGGIGSAWVNKRFGIKDPLTCEARTLFIQSLLKNSKALLENDPGYRDRVLAKQPEWRRAQWEDGDWDALEGQFFVLDPRMIREQEVPYWAEVYCGVDAGYYPSAFAAVWIAKWKDGLGAMRFHVMREVKKVKLNYVQQAKEALYMEEVGLPNHLVSARFADPSCWRRSEGHSGISTTTAMSWAESGFVVTSAYTNARAGGWILLRTIMEEKAFTIDPSCKALLEEMEGAVHDEKTDDIDDECEDHLLDALRYCLVSIAQNYYPESDTDPYDRSKKRKRLERKRRQKVTMLRS